MAKIFYTPRLEEMPAQLFLDDIRDPNTLSTELRRRPQWAPLADQVMAEFHKPFIALVWRGYIPSNDGIAEHDKMVDIFGVTIISPAEAYEMRYTVHANSFLNKKP